MRCVSHASGISLSLGIFSMANLGLAFCAIRSSWRPLGTPLGYVYECNVSGYQAHLEQPDSSVTLQQALIFGSTINAQSATPRARTKFLNKEPAWSND